MRNNAEENHELEHAYGFWARNRWLKQFVISLIFVLIVCVPVIYLLSSAQTLSLTVKLILVLGVPILVFDIWADRRYSELYYSISTTSEGLFLTDRNRAKKFVKWNEIERVANIADTDKDYFKAVKSRGIRLTLRDSNMIPIFESISDYEILKERLEENVTGELKASEPEESPE
ncbi:MAG: hypothetical protein AAF384_14670 [Pseudomonadota bacterium]